MIIAFKFYLYLLILSIVNFLDYYFKYVEKNMSDSNIQTGKPSQ